MLCYSRRAAADLIENQPEKLINPPDGLKLDIDWPSLMKKGMVVKNNHGEVSSLSQKR